MTRPPTPKIRKSLSESMWSHQPAEVLAEEAGHQRPQDEQRADDRDPRGDRVQAVGVGVEVGRGERGEVVVLAVQLAGDLVEVVADVAQVDARVAERDQPLEVVRGGLELVALDGRRGG